MATFKFKSHSSGASETIVANAAGATSSVITVHGPKQTDTYKKGRGLYIKESADTYRWVRDEPIDAAATEPLTFTAGNI